jgi:heme/copper-type cytochrome/quinol oxidase subunit 2
LGPGQDLKLPETWKPLAGGQAFTLKYGEFMRIVDNKLDLVLLTLLALVLLAVPFGIRAYDRHVWKESIPSGAREFTLTGHAQRGWVRGDVHAYDVLSLWQKKRYNESPLIEVTKGDLVVLKLKSSDVIHGFSLKDFGVFIRDGIQPGKVRLVSFRADKVGAFTFSCNAICGDNHQKMQGTLVVKA